MGQPKQLLPYQGHSLLRYMASVALHSCCHPITVVLGSQADRIRLEIDDLPLQIVDNERWVEGMGISIQAGLTFALNHTLDAVVIMLCDQPYVTSHLLNQLVESYQVTRRSIVASAYANALGVPALFSQKLFPQLLTLEANAGAKYLLERYRDQVYRLPFAEGAVDVDTPADYEQLLVYNDERHLI